MSVVLKQYMEGELTLELSRDAGELRLAWRGKSADREPGRFLMPVLAEALDRAKAEGLALALDFTGLDYMNSSTFTPVVKALDESRRLAVPVILEYSLTRKWQALSFSALRTFETLDGRIKVRGK
ncbi:MAG TPA: hypothetical protein VF894_00805 [Anaeromyxobacter sp.]